MCSSASHSPPPHCCAKRVEPDRTRWPRSTLRYHIIQVVAPFAPPSFVTPSPEPSKAPGADRRGLARIGPGHAGCPALRPASRGVKPPGACARFGRIAAVVLDWRETDQIVARLTAGSATGAFVASARSHPAHRLAGSGRARPVSNRCVSEEISLGPSPEAGPAENHELC